MEQRPSAKLVPNTKHPPPYCAWSEHSSRSGHLALQLYGHSHRSRHLRALAVSAHGARSLQAISGKNISHGHDAKLRFLQNFNLFFLDPHLVISPISSPYICILRRCNSIRADKFFELEMSVGERDLDQYGVVNHAIYCVYMEKAREKMITDLGISTASIACTGNAMALSELNLKYFTPLRSGDRFAVRVRVVQIKGARILVEHFIETLPDRELVLEATATAVCLNKDYRPTRVFPEMSSKLQQFFSLSQDV
uniref:Uncharacterized protein n=1 Tax=Avena sativa TaxID=4498 RepID=A0ACD5YSR0_AVESA